MASAQPRGGWRGRRQKTIVETAPDRQSGRRVPASASAHPLCSRPDVLIRVFEDALSSHVPGLLWEVNIMMYVTLLWGKKKKNL